MMRLLVPPVLLAAILVAVVASDREPPRADLVLASENEVFTLDPQRMSWLADMRVAYALFEGLVAWDTDHFTPQPALASSWTSSDDGMTWDFTLRTDARWSDGSPVTAHDVVWSWQRLLMPDTAADYSNLLFPIRGAEAFWTWRTRALADFDGDAEALMERTEQHFADTVGLHALDDHTFRVELQQPVPYLLDLFAFAPLLPVNRPAVEGWILDPADRETMLERGWAHITEPSWDDRRFVELSATTGRVIPSHQWARPSTLVSNGPYRLVDWRYRRALRMTRNPHFTGPGAALPETIEVRSFPDPSTALLAFRSGAVDWLTGVSADVRQDLLDAKAATDGQSEDLLVRSIHAMPAFGTDFFSFNCRETLPDGRPNPLHDARVRRAFALATDKQTIVDHVTGLGEPVSGSMTPRGAIDGYVPPEGLGFDTSRALDELAAAGWTAGEDGVLHDEDGAPFPVVELLYTTSTPRYRRMAAELRDQWQRHLGVEVHLVGQDSKFFGADLQKGNFMIARGRWYGDWGDPTTFLELFRSTDGNNDRGFADADIDRMLDESASLTDPKQRMAMLRDIEERIVEEHLPLIPICQLVEVTMYDPSRIGGMTVHPRLVQYLGEVDAGAAP